MKTQPYSALNPTRSRARGVSLIEVTISILILSIGALGLASLQINGKKASHEAVKRTTASSLAVDLIERMRANPSALDSYAVVSVGSLTRALPAKPAQECATELGACTEAELAAWDMWEWERAINGATALREGSAAGGLVNPVGCVTVANRTVTVEISWQGFEDLSVINAGADCGTGLYAADDANRQLLQMTSYVSDS